MGNITYICMLIIQTIHRNIWINIYLYGRTQNKKKPLFCIYDDEYNICWLSRKQQNIVYDIE